MARRRSSIQDSRRMGEIVRKVRREVEGREFYTVREVARLLRTSRHTILRWIRDGRIPGVRIGRTIRIPRAQLDEILGLK